MSKENKKKIRFWDGFWGTLIIFFILMIIASAISGCWTVFITSEGVPNELQKNLMSHPKLAQSLPAIIVSRYWVALLNEYLPVTVIGLVFFIFMKIKDKESYKTMLPSYGNNNLKNSLLGLLAGLGANAGLALLACAAGNIKLEFRGMGIGYLLIAFVFVAGQCIAEEVFDRVFLYQRFLRAYGPVFAIVGNSIVFSCMHISNLFMYNVEPLYGILALVNIVLIGIFFAETVYFGANVYFAFAFHTAWNFCQNFILGLPNSGKPATDSIFAPAGEATNGFFYSAKFGVEATFSATILIAGLCVAVFMVGRKKKAQAAAEA